MIYEDTYFINSDEAIHIASQNNYTDIDSLQICYYDGEKLEIDLPNLVHAPIDYLSDILMESNFRLPTKINFDSLELDDDVKNYLLNTFKNLIDNLKVKKREQYLFYIDKLRKSVPCFSEKLRVYLVAHKRTTVLQYMSRNIAIEFEKYGCEVFLDEFIGCEDLSLVKNIADFNPHIMFNIDHFNNEILNEHIYNFIWFQDLMPILVNENTILKRERDFCFHLTEHLNTHLIQKGISSSYQPFCIDASVYKKRESIKREKKIVFIGSSYKSEFDNIQNNEKYKIAEDILKYYLKYGYMLQSDRKDFISRYKDTTGFGHIFNYIERDLLLMDILRMNLEFELEVYGEGWEVYPELESCYKGILNHGEELSMVYNSATYGLVIGGYVMQQRTLESSASGAIPLVFDVRASGADLDQECFDDSLLFFKKTGDLKELLSNNHTKNLDCIVEKNSYSRFVKKMINLISK